MDIDRSEKYEVHYTANSHVSTNGFYNIEEKYFTVLW